MDFLSFLSFCLALNVCLKFTTSFTPLYVMVEILIDEFDGSFE